MNKLQIKIKRASEYYDDNIITEQIDEKNLSKFLFDLQKQHGYDLILCFENENKLSITIYDDYIE